MKKLIVPFLFLLFSVNANELAAQKRLKAAEITYELQKVESNIKDLNRMEGSKMTLTFNSDWQKSDIDIMNGLMRFQRITNLEKDSTIALYDLLGEQLKIEEKVGEDSTDISARKLKINYLKDSIRTIQGYECHKATLQDGATSITFWLTGKIKTSTSWFHQKYANLEGFPLEYESEKEGTHLQLMVQKINPEVDETLFAIPESYQLMSRQAFAEKMGGLEFVF